MKNLTVIAVSETKTEKPRSDGKLQREFVSVQFADKSNPFDVRTYTRNIFQRQLADGTNSWGATSPAILKSLTGKQIEGCEIATELTHPYAIEDRTVNKATMVLLPHESKSLASKMQAFRSQGHPLMEDLPLANSIVAEEATAVVAAQAATLRDEVVAP